MTSLIPSPQVSLTNGHPSTTSLAIAEHFGKRHDHVVRDIRKLMAELPEERRPNFVETFRTVAGPNNSERQEVYFTVFFDGFILLVMGYTGKKALQIKLVYIAAFNAMREQLDNADPPKALPATATPSTPDDRKPLRSLVFAWSQAAGVHIDTCWPQLKAHFQLSRINDLPVEWIPDAIDWVQAKIDAMPKQKALPTPEPKAPPVPLPEVTRRKLPLPYPFPREKIDVLLCDIRLNMLYIKHAEMDITDIMAAEYLRNNPGAPGTLKDQAYSRDLHLSCSAGSIWQSIDFALKAIEESINLRLESAS